MTLYDIVKYNAMICPNDIAFFSDKRNMTYSQLLAKADSVASYLDYCGIKQGDVVAVILPNIAETVITLYAINRLGAIAYMLNPQTPDLPLKELLKNSNAKFIFALRSYHIDIPTVVCDGFAEGVGFNFSVSKNCPHNTDEDLPAVYLQSGGTTDTPKTVIITSAQFNYVASTHSVLIPDANRDDKVLCLLPMFHAFGLCIGMHGFVAARVTLVLSNDYDAASTVKLIKKMRISYLVEIPRFYARLLKSPDFDTRLTYLRSAFVGGDHTEPELIKAFNEHMAKCGSTAILKEGYGLSETCSVVCVNRDDAYRIGSVGKPLPNTNIYICKDGEKINKPNEIGEIYIDTPALMNGYLSGKNTIKTIDGVRMLATGDVGYFDKDGFLYFTGRIKQSIKTSGVTVFPQEIESVIKKCEFVDDVLVVGVPDALKGEIIKAQIKLKENINEKEIADKLNKTMSEYLPRWSMPKLIEYVENFDLTPLGKKRLK